MIQTTHFNWLPTQTAWQESETWRARRQALVQDTLNAADMFNSSFATAASNRIDGLAQLAAQAAINRIKKTAKAKIDSALLKLDPSLAALGADKTTSSKTATAKTSTTTVDKKV